MQLNILCVGDVVGQPGRTFLANALPVLAKYHHLDLIVVNAENIAGGRESRRRSFKNCSTTESTSSPLAITATNDTKFTR